MSFTKPDDLTADFCHAKASGPQRIMLQHIAETWRRIADNCPANDA